MSNVLTVRDLKVYLDVDAGLVKAVDRFDPEYGAAFSAFAGRTIAVLGAEDLAVFKAMFDRPKDWVDIAAMAASGMLEPRVAAARLATVLGPGDDRVVRLAGPSTG